MSERREWPYCESVLNECVAHTLVSNVGGDILSLLIEFVSNPNSGSELTLKRDEGGFSFPLVGTASESRRFGVGETLSPQEIGTLMPQEGREQLGSRYLW